MAIATVTFRRCLVNSPESGSDEVRVGSRVFFDLNVGGQEFVDAYADVTRADREGSEHAPLVVTAPRGYDGPLNHPVFQGLVEFYYLQAVGGNWGLSGQEGLGLKLQNWLIEQEMVVQFDV